MVFFFPFLLSIYLIFHSSFLSLLNICILPPLSPFTLLWLAEYKIFSFVILLPYIHIYIFLLYHCILPPSPRLRQPSRRWSAFLVAVNSLTFLRIQLRRVFFWREKYKSWRHFEILMFFFQYFFFPAISFSSLSSFHLVYLIWKSQNPLVHKIQSFILLFFSFIFYLFKTGHLLHLLFSFPFLLCIVLSPVLCFPSVFHFLF